MPWKKVARAILGAELKLLSTNTYRQGFLWEVEKRRSKHEICPKCANPTNSRYGRVSVTVRQESLWGASLWLKIHKHRYFCKTCRKPFTETVPGVLPRRKTTQRFRKALLMACKNYKNLSEVRRTFKCSSALLYKVFYEQLEIKLREKKSASWPEVVCVDEHFFSRRKGFTEFVTMFADYKKGTLFEMAEGKDKKSLWEQMERIPGREKVKSVVIDMSSSYRSFIKEFFPNAEITADKFHVLRLLGPSIIKHRKLIHGHMQELHLRRKLLMNRWKLDYFVRSELDQYLKKHPVLNELYRYKERLHELYRTKGYARARSSIDRLLEQMKTSQVPEIQRLRRTLVTWKREILNYFINGYTNGLVEALNNTGKLVQKQAYGYKSFKNYRLRTLSACS
jgi:transposase